MSALVDLQYLGPESRVEQEITGKVLVYSKVIRTICNSMHESRRKLSGWSNYTMPIISLLIRALSIDNNDLGSVIKVNLCYFELRKIIFKVEFLLIIPFKVEFFLRRILVHEKKLDFYLSRITT